ncbi:MAG: hypothetical protein WCO19_00175 [Candidatus Saccharibacteria bacterium]
MPIQKKKQSLFSKLGAKLRTPKGRLIATILIFGAIGGGILVYRSFAATPPSQTWNYTIDAGNVEYGSPGTINGPVCPVSTFSEPQKSNMKVANLTCAANTASLPAKSVQVAFTKGTYLPASYTNSNIRICAYIKGIAANGSVNVAIFTASGYQNSLWNLYRGDYGYYCSPYVRLTKASYISGHVELYSSANPANIAVGTIVLEKQ